MKRIAVKIGSNVLTRKDGTLDITRMSALVDQVADLHRQGMEIVLISSGAVASGRSEIKAGKKLDPVSARQLYSAVGHTSSYQSTKAKAHKARGHKGANTRQRRTSTSQTGRRGKRR